MRVPHLASLAGVVAMIACSSTSDNLTNPTGTASVPSGATAVTIQDFSYSPSNVNVKVGATVVWTNAGPSAHTTVSDDGMWNSGPLNPSGGSSMYGSGSVASTFQFTFSQAGTFRYHCSIHPPSVYPQFVGAVVVTP